MIKESTVTKTLLRGHSDQVLSIASSPVSPSLVASSSADGTVRLWDLRQGRAVRLFRSESTADMQNIIFRQDSLLVSNGDNILAYDMGGTGVIVDSHSLQSP